MNILVTGADGFVGTALCDTLRAQGYSVTTTTRADTGIISGDTDWTRFLRGAEIVVHLANRAHVAYGRTRNTWDVFSKVNVEGTRTIAAQAAVHGVKRFIYLSSISVNGRKTDGNVFTENDTPTPGTTYARSKWIAEQELHAIATKTAMEIVILRPPLVYGPGVKANFLTLLRAVDKKIPLPFLLVRNKRNFIALSNLIDAITLCLHHPAAAGQTFLVADDEAISTPDLIRSLAVLMRKPALLFPFPVALLQLMGKILGREPAVDGVCSSLEVDSSKIKTMLGWNPPFTLQQRLAKTVEWYMSVARK